MSERVKYSCPCCDAESIIFRGNSIVQTDTDPNIVVLGRRPSVIEYPCGKCGSKNGVVYCCDKCFQFLCRSCVEG